MTYCGERGRVRLRDFKMAVTCDVSSLASSRAPPAISPSRLALSLTAAIALRQTRYIADVALQIRHSRFRVPKLRLKAFSSTRGIRPQGVLHDFVGSCRSTLRNAGAWPHR